MTTFFFENPANESCLLPSCNSTVEKDVQCRKNIMDNDDSSLSSTASFSTLSSQDSLSTCTAASTTGTDQTSRHVTFNDNIYYEPHVYYREEEKADLWYTVQDYKQFKSIASYMAIMINNNEPSTPFSRVLEKVYEECQVDTEQDEDSTSDRRSMRRMRQLFHGTPDSAAAAAACVGLEQRSCLTIGRNRSYCRRELVRIVYKMQKQKENENDCMSLMIDDNGEEEDDDDDDDDNYYLEQMRFQCERVSQRSRVFARILAQAQWEAELE